MGTAWDPQRYAPTADYLFPASRAAVQALALRCGELLVDSATGTGNAAVLALERGARVLGLDSSSAQIAVARRRCLHPDSWFVVADVQHLPLPPSRADAAVSVFGIIFAADPARALAELTRCVRPGGRVAFTTLCTGGWPSRAREVLAGELGTAPPAFPGLWSTPGAAGSAAADAGLDAVEVATRELRFPIDLRHGSADQVTSRMGALSVLREQLERRDRWQSARDRLDRVLAGCLGSDSALVDRYVLVTGRRP